MTSAKFKGYQNAMEPLVADEMEQQLQTLPRNLAEAIDLSEAMVYALNRLPPLYATSPQGWAFQLEYARENLQRTIPQAVAWGLRVAQRKQKNSSAPAQTEFMGITTHF